MRLTNGSLMSCGKTLTCSIPLRRGQSPDPSNFLKEMGRARLRRELHYNYSGMPFPLGYPINTWCNHVCSAMVTSPLPLIMVSACADSVSPFRPRLFESLGTRLHCLQSGK